MCWRRLGLDLDGLDNWLRGSTLAEVALFSNGSD
jgi:hypothetical protein